MTQRQTIELSAFWILFMKVVMCLATAFMSAFLAVGVPWIRWVTETSYQAENTAAVVDRVVAELKDVNSRMSSLPPQEWRERIIRLEDASVSNREDHAIIKAGIEVIKQRLGATGGGT